MRIKACISIKYSNNKREKFKDRNKKKENRKNCISILGQNQTSWLENVQLLYLDIHLDKLSFVYRQSSRWYGHVSVVDKHYDDTFTGDPVSVGHGFGHLAKTRLSQSWWVLVVFSFDNRCSSRLKRKICILIVNLFHFAANGQTL